MIKTWRLEVLVQAVLTIALLAAMPLSGAAQVGPGYGIQMSRMIPMRDGMELEAWIIDAGNLKEKRLRSSSLRSTTSMAAAIATPPQISSRRGYAFVQAYVRGRGSSGGFKTDNLGCRSGAMATTLSSGSRHSPGATGESSCMAAHSSG